MRFLWMAFLVLTLSAALAQDADDRPDLTGKWQIDPARSDGGNGVTLSIEAKEDSVHYVQDTRGENAEFNCTIDGKECPMTDGGHKAKISVWYNGPSLVMMETRGNSVVKRKLTLTGTSLEMEVVPIVPQGKTDKLVFTKQG
jgi:hypothetical protein